MKEFSDHAKEVQRRYPLGLRVCGTVVDRVPFGFFVDLGDPAAVGLVQIIDILDVPRRMLHDEFPVVLVSVEAVVIGWKDTHWKNWPCEVALSVKPSLLCAAEREKILD